MRSTYAALALLGAFALVSTTGCNPLNKMNKKHPIVKYTMTPDPLELHNDSVEINVSGRYPAKFFPKKAVANVKPVMVDANGNVVKEFETIRLIGEAADGEGTKIYKAGGSFSVSNEVPYESSMENVTLEVRVTAGYKTKTKEFDPVAIGKGTVTTPLWVQSDDMPILGADKFTKVSPRTISAEINFDIQSSYVKPSELSQDDIKAVEAFMEKGKENEYRYNSVNVTAYASPDGETELNENLAGDRANAASNAIMRLFTRKKIEGGGKDEIYKKMPKGEDWEGFKAKMEASSIEDKDMILRILGMYSDDKKREQEIKNLAATYTVIAEQILPPLRRAVVMINAEEDAKSDEELKQIVKENPSELTAEEILYTATLYNNLNEKLEVYKACAQAHADDWRGHNNIGYVYVLQNKVAEAKAQFEAANNASANEKVVMNNMGVVSRLMGDEKAAADYYEKAKGAGKEVNYNIGILNIMDADYSDAVSNMGTFNTFNAALAKVLNGDQDDALNTVEASDAKATAEGYYLKAIIGARKGTEDMVIQNLKAAVGKDAALKDKARNDAEFLNYRDNSSFTEIVGN